VQIAINVEEGRLAAESYRGRNLPLCGAKVSAAKPRRAAQRRAFKRSALHAELLVKNVDETPTYCPGQK